MTPTITRTEREDLLKICRLRARNAKAEVGVMAATRLAEFEEQLATTYSFDQHEVWEQAVERAHAAWKQASEEIRRHCAELGIPRQFAPSLGSPYWRDRGENAVKERRAELTRVAHKKIEQHEKEAKLAIDRASEQIQVNLLACNFGSEAKALLEGMPTAAQLMPTLSVNEVQKQLTQRLPYDDEDL